MKQFIKDLRAVVNDYRANITTKAEFKEEIKYLILGK